MRFSLMKSLLEVSTSGELSVRQQQDSSSSGVLLQLFDRCDVPQEHLLPSLPPPPLRSDQPLLWIQSRPRLPATYRRGQTTARRSRRRPRSSAAGEPEPLPTLALHPHTGETGSSAFHAQREMLTPELPYSSAAHQAGSDEGRPPGQQELPLQGSAAETGQGRTLLHPSGAQRLVLKPVFLSEQGNVQ